LSCSKNNNSYRQTNGDREKPKLTEEAIA
jgi:hypothetical protein